MKPPEKFTAVVNKTRYSVETATLIAHDAFWDGHNYERHGQNTFLYRTPKGNYFRVILTQWQGSHDSLEPVSQDEAISLYERDLPVHEVPYGEAFPGVVIQDA